MAEDGAITRRSLGHWAVAAAIPILLSGCGAVLQLSSFNGEALPLGHREDYSQETFSPFHVAPITNTGHIAIADLDEAAERAWVEWGTSVDSESQERKLAFVWAAYRSSVGAGTEPLEIPDIDIRHFGLFQIDLATGQTRDARIEQRSSVEDELLQKITRVVQAPVENGRVVPRSKRTPAACRHRPGAQPRRPGQMWPETQVSLDIPASCSHVVPMGLYEGGEAE